MIHNKYTDMKVKAIIETGKDHDYDIYTNDDTLGFMLLGQGKTIAEAKKDFLRCKDEMAKLYTENDDSFDFDKLEFEYVFDTISFLKYSPFTLTWLSIATGINKKQLSHYTTGTRHPGHKTLLKIQKAVNSFVHDHNAVVFN